MLAITIMYFFSANKCYCAILADLFSLVSISFNIFPNSVAAIFQMITNAINKTILCFCWNNFIFVCIITIFHMLVHDIWNLFAKCAYSFISLIAKSFDQIIFFFNLLFKNCKSFVALFVWIYWAAFFDFVQLCIKFFYFFVLLFQLLL